MNKLGPKKILLIRFSSIGDIVLTSPVIRCLKQQLGAELHFLTKENYRNQLEAHPMIDQLFLIRSSVKEVLPKLREAQYDCIIDLHKNLRSLQVRWALRRPVFSFDKLNIQKWLIVNLKMDRLPRKHLVDRYFDGLQGLGIVNDQKGLDYYIPKKEEVSLSELWPAWKNFAPAYIAFAIGAAHGTKRLPEEQIIASCKVLSLPIVLLGGAAERERGEAIVKAVGEKVLNACGQLSISGSASLIRQAELVITHDTGMMHIAAAFNKKIISIWGSTVPEFGMYPYYKTGQEKGHIMEVKGLSCRPCSKIGHQQCPKGHFSCMKGISPEEIGRLAATARD